MKLLDAFKAAFDSLVRTYSPMIIGAVLAGLALIMGPVEVPDDVVTFVTLLVALLFQMLWFGIIRIIELVRGKASKLLGLGLVKAQPVYVKTAPDADDAGHATVGRVMGAAVVALVVMLIVTMMMLFGARAANSSEPGCVFSGGGWICYGTQQPSEPGELPVVSEPEPAEVVEPAAPVPVPAQPAPAPVDPAPVAPAAPTVPVQPAPAPVAPAVPPSSCG